jgi:peptide/nickel transport system ATP-binding protein/oligopeptide transport system ATP-binding protein
VEEASLGIGATPVQQKARDDSSPDGKILEVRDLHTHFRTMDGVVKAVDGVSFDIAAGASVGIVGESGSGKSVTSLSIMRLIEPPGWIASGQILFRGKDLASLSEEEMRKVRGDDISMVFQEPMTALNPVYTVGDQVAEVLREHRKMSRRDAMRRTIELFKMVGIPAAERRVNEYPHNLSGGMRQRVMIAMALANEPDLLILDEPTTALDVTIQAQILELVKNLRTEVNTAVLLITHDIGVIAEMSDEVIVMYGGKVMERANVLQIIKDPKHPYTKGLLASIPSLGMKNQRLNVIAGAVPNPLNMPPGCPFAPRCPYVMDICRTMPELKTLDDGRQVFCWLY